MLTSGGRPVRGGVVLVTVVLVTVVLVSGVLVTAITAPLVVLSWWDRGDECAEAIAMHRDLLVREADRVSAASGVPEVGCDDTAGPPVYAAVELDPRTMDRFGSVVARQGWECAPRSDDEERPGLVCTKAVAGVALELSTTEVRNGTVEAWLTADLRAPG